MKGKNLLTSISICTHNGEKTLSQCLESLNKQTYQKNKVEILVIDNASTDSTKNIAQDFIKKSKFKCRYIFEPKLGLSVARNRGIKEARGEIVAFIDDDATADKGWLKNLSRCFKNGDIWAVGGRVKPKFEIEPPDWLPLKYLSVLTICNLGPKIKEVPHIVGTNMAFMRGIFQQVGLFRTDLGRKGNNLLSGEELDLCERITKASGKIIYNPKVVVYHLVSRERLNKKYFCKRLLMEGFSWARIDKEKTHLRKRLYKAIFQKPKVLLVALSRFIFFALLKDDKKSFSNWCEFLLYLGYIYESYRLILPFLGEDSGISVPFSQR